MVSIASYNTDLMEQLNQAIDTALELDITVSDLKEDIRRLRLMKANTDNLDAMVAALNERREMIHSYDPATMISLMGGRREEVRKRAERRSQIVRSDLPNIQIEIDLIEAQVFEEILERKNPDGKPTYTNDASRKAAVTIALYDAINYEEFIGERIELQKELDKIDAETEAEHREYVGYRYCVERQLAVLKALGA